MTVSVVLRLAEQALAAGQLAGEVEVVETGERRVVRDAEGLVTFLASRALSAAETPGTAHGGGEGGRSR